MIRKYCAHICILALLLSTAAKAEKIEDNSYLLEEAYNQESGVVQFINTYQYLKEAESWAYSFTNEIPVVSQDHQFSYTIPVLNLAGVTGLGDIAINYRYQLLNTDKLAMTPRFSLLAPTGKTGIGTKEWGLQFNHAISYLIHNNWVTHFNLGLTYYPKSTSSSLNSGASIIYLFKENLNFLFEATGNAVTDGVFSGFINPGLRYALNFPSGLQIVPGISTPIGIGSANGEYGVFLYLSFEDKFW